MIPTATNTALPTATITIAPTATVTLFPTPDLSGIEVLGAGPSNGFYLVNFYKPGIDKPYLVQTDAGIPFKCDLYEAYPDRLICYGPMLSWGEKVTFNFIDIDSGEKVYSLDHVLPDRDWGFAEKQIYNCVHSQCLSSARTTDALRNRGKKRLQRENLHYRHLHRPVRFLRGDRHM